MRRDRPLDRVGVSPRAIHRGSVAIDRESVFGAAQSF
jgi:hypothetical protein